MSNSKQERLAAELQKAKAEGSARASRIGAIVKEAATQAFAEVKAGSGELGAIARSSLSTAVTPPTEPGSEPETAVSPEAIPQPSGWKASLATLLQTLRVRLSQQFQKEYTDAKQQMSQMRDRANQLDTQLTERYGDRYTNAKQRVDETRTQAGTWYANTRAQAEAEGIDPIQQQQVQAETKAAEAGSFVAQKEQQLRQQLKERLQNLAPKQ